MTSQPTPQAPQQLLLAQPDPPIWPWKFAIGDQVTAHASTPIPSDALGVITAAATHRDSGCPHYLVRIGRDQFWLPQFRLSPCKSR